MPEFGGLESSASEENAGSVSEGVSEQAKERFTASQAAIKKIRQEEKKAKKRDDQVAHAIIRFLQNEIYAHLFQLISRLVARDCPSVFVLSILSLIDESSIQTIEEFLTEHNLSIDRNITKKLPTVPDALPEELAEDVVQWISRMQVVMSLEARVILMKLMIDEDNIDGTVLQLTTFVLQEFFHARKMNVPFEELHPVAAAILHTVFEPFLHLAEFEKVEESQDQDDNN